MTLTATPQLDDVYTAVKAFVMGVLPLDNAHVVKGTQNRAAMPVGPFVEMWDSTQIRLSTTVDTYDSGDDTPADDSVMYQQSIKLEMQLSVYGPASGDWAAVLSTVFRDTYGCNALAPNCQPLYNEDPMRSPLDNGEEQYEDKWIVRAYLQYTPVVETVAQFADAIVVGIKNVDVTYPPS